MSYQCPLCFQLLPLSERTYCCKNNHQFDMAKEGYVNLMPAQHKRSKDPGDNKDMMQARRRFLEAGHYEPMRQAVATLCSIYLKNSNAQLLDIGCGEGYYTHQVEQTLKTTCDHAQIFGLDISKIAIRYASKRYPNCHFSVASSHRIPFSDSSLDAILRIYAPCKAEELSRTLREDGVVVTVTPASRHLYQLREQIYQQVHLHDETPEQIDGFELMQQDRLNYRMALSGNDALDLLQMTPFAWKASDEFRAALKSSTQFECEADFMLRVYRKVN